MTKVLIVEDDNNLREIYETSLKAEGYDTAAAADGMEALEVAAREKPDLIISDVMMPRLSGFEMLEKLKQDDGLKDVPVIMMTALSMAEDKDTAKRLGVVHYLVKSQVTLEDFVSVAKKFVPPDGSSPTASSPAPDQPDDSVASPAADESAATTPQPTASEEPSETGTDTASQTTTQETDAVEAKINEFIANQPTSETTAPQAEAPAQVEGPAAPETVESTGATADVDKQGKKIIQPPASEQKDIHELAKAEESKEAASQATENPKAGSSVDPGSVAL